MALIPHELSVIGDQRIVRGAVKRARVGPAANRAETEADLPCGWRGPTLERPLSTLPALEQVEELVQEHDHRIAELADTIKSGHHRPGVSSTVTIAIRVGEDALRGGEAEGLTVLGGGEGTSAHDTAGEVSEEGDLLLGNAIHAIDECFDLIASSRLAAAKAVSAISAADRCQASLLRSLHQLGAIDGIAFSSYSNQLKSDFNATKLELARRWLEHGRDEVDIGKVTKRLYRHALGATDVAAAISDILDVARNWGRLGDHPHTGDPVFVKVGPNGRIYVQLGRRSEPSRKRTLRVELPDRVEYEGFRWRVRRSGTHVDKGGDPSEVTFEQALRLIDDKLERQRPWGMDPKSGRPIYLRSGYGPYLQLGRTIPAGGSGEIVRVGVPPDIEPEDLTLEQASRLLHRKMERDRPLGVHPETGQNVYSKDSRWGGFVQLGERKRDGPRPKIVSLPDGVNPEDVDLQDALDLLGQAVLRTLGVHPDTGAPVTLQTDGRFGPFVSHRDVHATVPGQFDPMAVTLEEAVRFLAASSHLRSWLREARAALWGIVSPPEGVFVAAEGFGPSEVSAIVEQRRTEWLSGQTAAQRNQMLNELEDTRTRQERRAREAEWRSDIAAETLERWIGYLGEEFEKARQPVVRSRSS